MTLAEEGRKIALSIVRKHEVLERLLTPSWRWMFL
ncbi:MAG: hypothetical protein B9J98_06880 [Candidatus Terraquivivens tikiterensis]|uniref:Uncharacterized protein n=1 Tax=Candidatus Terraquivivens tikiterensis TaxID=1980982 RepID=A0A2R7Y188_9ARCH|nr:MAG: hypothetical protein B9J98_06880 [Candidatus Terraquivivens tikiterensis]